MLNVGPLELLVVLAVALIVVGPERLPDLARAVGRALRQFRDVQNEVRDMVSLGVDEDVKQAASELKKATGSVRRATDVKGAVRRSLQDDAAPPPSRPAASRPSSPRSASSRSEPPAASPREPAEAGGPPADRLTSDGSAESTPPEREEPAS